ncbi:MAG: purine/pyrimidine permease [Deltaproteobacteria bacterium]|nr:purine/pyrimidine permease [Deltaproteobacteria bacterium]
MQFEYGLDDRVPFLKSALFGIQWAAVLISTIIILGKVIGVFHSFDPSGQILYLQKLLFVSAVILVIQVFWGHRLTLLPGPSAILLIGVISSRGFELSTVYTSVMIAGLFITVLAVSGLFKYFQKLFTTNVVSVVLLLVAFTLAPTIRNLVIAPKTGIHPLYNIMFALILCFMMFLAYRMLSGIWKSTLIIWSMIAGSLGYLLLFPESHRENLFSNALWVAGFFHHLTLDISIEPGVIISFIFCVIALSVNDLGSIQSVIELLEVKDSERRVTRGITLTGIANIASGFFGVIGPVNFSLSAGVFLSTGCASRFALLPAAAITFVLAFLPVATGFISSVPSVVIGVLLIYVMTSQIAAGLMVVFRDTEKRGFDLEKGLVIGLPLLLGTIVAFLSPDVLQQFPPFLRPILGNGFAVGIASALVLEHIIFRKGME